MSFDQFRGYIPDAPASIYDVQRRQKLAETLLGNKVQNGSALGALADTLAGTASGWEGTQASDEAQSGYTDANKALGAALSGDANPSDLIQAGGNPFLPQSESGLVGDLIKRKMGIGETFYGTPQYSVDPNDPTKIHTYVIGSLGTVKEIKPGEGGGAMFNPKLQISNTGTAQTAINPITGLPENAVPINNAQAESDKSYGSEVGKIVADAPQMLQKTGQSLVLLNRQADSTAATIDQAISQIQSNPDLMAGTVGAFAKAVPGTPQYDLAKTLTTINANQVIGTLDQMRANSPTGASGMGSVSNFEDELLGSINGSADQGQTGAQLVANLQKMKTILNNLKGDRNQAFEADKSRLGNPPPAAPIVGGQQPSPAAPAASGKVLTYNPATGELE